MRDKKIKILVGILLSLIVFTSSVAFLMYTKQSAIRKNLEENVDVYVSAKDIKKGDMIGAKEMQLAHLPKSYVGTQALTQEEIMGHYATVDMLKNEPLRAEKLSLQKPQEEAESVVITASDINTSAGEKKELQVIDSDTLPIPLDLFRNIDTSLTKGDYIDIVSVMPKRGEGNEIEFTTRYIALHVQIASIVFPYTPPQDEKSKVKPVSIPGGIVLRMEPKDIKNFLKLYYTVQNINNNRVYNEQNKGHLWMIKCSQTSDTDIENYKQVLVLDSQKKIQKAKAAANYSVSIIYEK
ncbi:MAG: hypothetical protein FP820_08565 [Sulfurimonas sp.]|nr:hypothetical protein [Sulfurimonas sp.]MBU3939290.1 flagella basal body P-ring formation protein FlgA [bacterium]MBU4024111.1 flagella basal body P-ring formation protein FlgA [bacterium]MBU4058467.1 flagella basal body P-ring formation protein FlgA [bacterium]MBU4109670.1 flagella basal body P-ring formation protein FlgA [bacterium]